jgi:hypothetical protein
MVKALIFAVLKISGGKFFYKSLWGNKKLKKFNIIFGRVKKVCIFALPNKKG